MPSRPRLVLFDMDNVLCDYDRLARAAVLAEIAGLTADEVYQRMWPSGLETLGDSGALSADAYLDRLSEVLGCRLTVEHWLAARKASMRPDREMLEIVARLRGVADVAVLTNNSTLVSDHIDQLYPELRPLFGTRIFASAAFRTAKPDPRCYALCLEALEMPPAATLFIDDLAENVEGARLAGLAAHQHTTAAALRPILADYQLLA